MRYRLGDFNLEAPEKCRISSGQKVAEIEVPFDDNVIVNMGSGLKTFSWDGKIALEDGGIETAYLIDDAKARGDAIVLGIGSRAWDAIITDFTPEALGGDHCGYSITLREVKRNAAAAITAPQPELGAVGNTDELVKILSANQSAFNWYGIQDKICRAMARVVSALGQIEGYVVDIRKLAELPADVLALVRALAEIVKLNLVEIAQEARAIIDVPDRIYEDGDELLKDCHQAAQEGARQMALLLAAIPIVPAGEQSYVVQQGDTLVRIAVKLYGDKDGWQQIAIANQIWRAEDLVVGSTIIIPGRT